MAKSSPALLSASRPGFQAALHGWYRTAQRPLPWRQAPSLYKTVVSELMLQQTQVATVLPYFDRWLRALPDFAALAAVLATGEALPPPTRGARLVAHERLVAEADRLADEAHADAGRIARIEVATKKGELVKMSEVEAGLIQVSMAIKMALLRLPTILAPRLQGLEPRHIEKEVREQIETIIDSISKEKIFATREKKNAGNSRKTKNMDTKRK